MGRFQLIRYAAVAAVLAATGCGSAATATGDDGTPSRPPAGGLALRVESVGGFVGPAVHYSRIPTVSVYADGRVLTQGPELAIYPGPAVPNLRVRQISVPDVDRLVARARTAGVGTTTDYGMPSIADATSTRFTVLGSGRTRTSEVYALGEATEQGLGLTGRQRAARATMRGLLAALTDLPRTLGTQAAGVDRSYRATAVAAVARPWTTGGDVQSPARAWPGPALPGAALGSTGLNCVTATGAGATRVLAAASTANAVTPWTYRGKRWSIVLRPLLPDESGCADLGR